MRKLTQQIVTVALLYFLGISCRSDRQKAHTQVPLQAKREGGLQTEMLEKQPLGKHWNIAYLPDGRILMAEKNGIVGIIEHGFLGQIPYLDLRDSVIKRKGYYLEGLIPDPHFDKNHLLYVMYMPKSTRKGKLKPQIVRYREDSISKKPTMEAILRNSDCFRFKPLHTNEGRKLTHAAVVSSGDWNGSLLFMGLLDDAIHRATFHSGNVFQTVRIDTYCKGKLSPMSIISMCPDGKLCMTGDKVD